MDLSQLPAPPANPYKDWEQLPQHFQNCADTLTAEFGLDQRLPPSVMNGGPEDFLTAWLNLNLGDIDPEAPIDPGQIDRLTVTSTPIGALICIPIGFGTARTQLIRALFAATPPQRSTWRRSNAYKAAPWLDYFLECWRVGCYEVESTP